MTRKHIVLFVFAIHIVWVSFAQQSAVYTNEFEAYQKALSLYNNQQYLAAQANFKKVKKTVQGNAIEANCAYYIANCAVRLNQKNANTLIQNFVDDYPTSTKRNSAFLDVAAYYFENGKFAYSEKWYSKVNENSLSKNERETFYFNRGYTAFSSKNFKDAKKYLNKVENSQKYGSQAKYYIGYMAYEGDDYDKANVYFNQVEGEDKYKEKLSYYQSDLNFKLGKFDKAITLAKAQLKKTNDKDEVSQLNKIAGESYFNLNKYAEAIPYLKDYKGKKGKWTNTDYYQLGYAYYKQQNYDKAISEFNKIIDGDNSVAQNAYYHLGASYVNLNKKQEALNAFRNASQMDYDLKIQEDAWHNYAKISYDIGNPYQSVPRVLTSYLDKYPKSSHRETVETLLIDSYITSKNYKEALVLLKGKKSAKQKAAYQKVTYYRGIELFNENKYAEAVKLFNNSLNEPIDAKYAARATFWKAETNFNLTNYEAALIGFKQFQQQIAAKQTPEYNNLNYHLAYTYFKQKKYDEAIQNFKTFTTNNKKDQVRLNDAYLRLADSYFVTSNYNNAINSYEAALTVNKIEMDYAYFQKAMSFGYLGQTDKKISNLERFITQYPNSKLRDDAMYTLGNAYVKSGSADKGLAMYGRLISEYNNNSFTSKALLRQGLIYYNNGNNEKALTQFKKVASDFPNAPEANQAVATARLIYIDLGRVNEYATWVQTLDYVEVSDGDLDQATYQSAEKQYLDNNTNQAITLFKRYLKDFENGLHVLQSHFYLAQLYFKNQQKDKAKPHYNAVIDASRNEFTEEALLRLSQIILEQNQWLEAIPILKRLDAEANFPQNSLFAQSNLMQANYQLNNYTEAVAYAEKVLTKPNLDNKVKSDAYLIMARSALQTKDDAKAKAAYAKVELSATGETAAEALYYNAYFKNKDGRYKASNTAIQRLAKDFSGYRLHGAKGLIIMAKNQYALDDAFQATYILESVINNFSDFPDVVTEAETELNRIKTEQAKTNASVETED